MARSIGRCNERLGPALLSLPILRQVAPDSDRLPGEMAYQLVDRTFVTRPSQARALRNPVRMWLVPGPRNSCVFLYDGSSGCRDSDQLVRRGMFVAREGCPVGRTPITGVTPAGVRTLRLLRRGRVVKQVSVINGAWRAIPDMHPDTIVYARIRLHVPSRVVC